MGNNIKISKGKPSSIIIQICILLNPSTVMFIKATKQHGANLRHRGLNTTNRLGFNIISLRDDNSLVEEKQAYITGR